jgi:hypothetical protein
VWIFVKAFGPATKLTVKGAPAGDVSHCQREPIEVLARWQRQESERARDEESVEGNGVLSGTGGPWSSITTIVPRYLACGGLSQT